MPVLGGGLKLPFILGAPSGEKEKEEEGIAGAGYAVGPPVTFTIKPEFSGYGGGFVGGPKNEYHLIKDLMVSGKIVGVTNEYIKEGLRGLGIFEEG